MILMLLLTSKLDVFCHHELNTFNTIGTCQPISYCFKTKFLTQFERG